MANDWTVIACLAVLMYAMSASRHRGGHDFDPLTRDCEICRINAMYP